MKFSIFNFQFSKLLKLTIILFFLFLMTNQAQAALVPCGPGFPPPHDRCQLCHLFVMLDIIIDFFLTRIVLPIALLLLVVGGGMFLFYAENPKRIEQGKSILTSVVIGLVIIFAAWLIINSFFLLIGVAGWTGLREGWFQIKCP